MNLTPSCSFPKVITQDAKEVDLDKLEEVCGTNYCPGADFPTLDTTKSGLPVEEGDSISKRSLYILAGVYLACSLASAAVVALFVDPLTRYGRDFAMTSILQDY